MFKLLEFQEGAVNQLIDHTELVVKNNKQYGVSNEVLFTSPVASGKTIMSGHFMHEYFTKQQATGRDYAFVWLTPGIGELEEQSRDKIAKMNTDIKTLDYGDLKSQGRLNPGDALFMNWELLNPENHAMKGGDFRSIEDIMALSEVNVIVMIDEAHHTASTEKSLDKIDIFKPDAIIHITATPDVKHHAGMQQVKVVMKDAVEQQLVKKYTVLNKDLTSLEQKDVMRAAIHKMEDIKQAFSKVKRSDNKLPLCLIQISNDKGENKDTATKKEADRITEMLHELGIPLEKIAIKLAETETNYYDINNSDIEYLIIKQAVATGWDCPRAHVLVRFREIKSETFDTQTIGRILRTTERKHYGNDLLDAAYIYTDSEEYTIEASAEVRGDFLNDNNFLKLKEEAVIKMGKMRFPMKKKRNVGKKHMNYSTEKLHNLLEKTLILPDGAKKGKGSQASLYHKVNTATLQTSELDSEELNGYQKKEIKGDKKSDERIAREFREKISRLDAGFNIRRQIYRTIKNQLPQGTLAFDVHETFLNYETHISQQIRKVLEHLEVERDELSINEYSYRIIDEVYVREKKAASDNYAYDGQPSLDVKKTKSGTEMAFGKFLDAQPNVLYWYKNEAHGKHYSFVYRYKEDGKELTRNYYPDFIVLTRDKRVYFLDVKAPIGEKDYPYVAEKYNESRQFVKENHERYMVGNDTYRPVSSIVKHDKNSGRWVICQGESYIEPEKDIASWSYLDDELGGS